MFVQNQAIAKGQKSHLDVIVENAANSSEIRLAVAYVKEKGVKLILKRLKNSRVKLLCALDMGITDISALDLLLKSKVDVKIYKKSGGTFHPKTWLFKRGEKWLTLVGSANLTSAALTSNVEASVLLQDEDIAANAVKFFDYLWQHEETETITPEDIARLTKAFAARGKMREAPLTIADKDAERNILDFVYGWVDIAKEEKRGISSIWRGWYVIPDQGYVSDSHIKNLRAYMQKIGGGVNIDRSEEDEVYGKLLQLFYERSNFKREELKLSRHSLFVRQAKNYLIKFGWAERPIKKKKERYTRDKSFLLPTPLRKEIAQSANLDEARTLYSDYFEEYSYNGLRIVGFTRSLLKRLERLTLDEFNFFVCHAYTDEDLDLIESLIRAWRDYPRKQKLEEKIKRRFYAVKEGTAKNVYGNYVKSVKHTMSAIGWCNGFVFHQEKMEISLANAKN